MVTGREGEGEGRRKWEEKGRGKWGWRITGRGLGMCFDLRKYWGGGVMSFGRNELGRYLVK